MAELIGYLFGKYHIIFKGFEEEDVHRNILHFALGASVGVFLFNIERGEYYTISNIVWVGILSYLGSLIGKKKIDEKIRSQAKETSSAPLYLDPEIDRKFIKKVVLVFSAIFLPILLAWIAIYVAMNLS